MGIEVIGASYGRTGTSSFQVAMEILGFGRCYHMKEAFANCSGAQWTKIADERNPTLVRDLMEQGNYRSTCDMPSSVYWLEQLQIYPDAKVVLTLRDPEKWYKSWMDTIGTVHPDSESCYFGNRVIMGMGLFQHFSMTPMFNKVITRDCFNGDWSKQNLIACYKAHIENVKKLCPPDKLLLFDVKDGWEPLCTFLGVPVPDLPYPHANDTSAFLKMASVLHIVGWIMCILGLGIPALYRSRSIISDEAKKSTNTA